MEYLFLKEIFYHSCISFKILLEIILLNNTMIRINFTFWSPAIYKIILSRKNNIFMYLAYGFKILTINVNQKP